MAEVESAVKSLLETVTSNLSSSSAIYAVLGPQNAVKPYVVFDVVGDDVTNVMGTETKPTRATVEVMMYASTFLEIVNITNDIRGAFNRYSGTINSVVIQDIFYDGRDDYYDEPDRTYERSLTFTIWYEE